MSGTHATVMALKESVPKKPVHYFSETSAETHHLDFALTVLDIHVSSNITGYYYFSTQRQGADLKNHAWKFEDFKLQPWFLKHCKFTSAGFRSPEFKRISKLFYGCFISEGTMPGGSFLVLCESASIDSTAASCSLGLAGKIVRRRGTFWLMTPEGNSGTLSADVSLSVACIIHIKWQWKSCQTHQLRHLFACGKNVKVFQNMCWHFEGTWTMNM